MGLTGDAMHSDPVETDHHLWTRKQVIINPLLIPLTDFHLEHTNCEID